MTPIPYNYIQKKPKAGKCTGVLLKACCSPFQVTSPV